MGFGGVLYMCNELEIFLETKKNSFGLVARDCALFMLYGHVTRANIKFYYG